MMTPEEEFRVICELVKHQNLSAVEVSLDIDEIAILSQGRMTTDEVRRMLLSLLVGGRNYKDAVTEVESEDIQRYFNDLYY